nr:hypothetical protein [Streptomyces diacarni]
MFSPISGPTSPAARTPSTTATTYRSDCIRERYAVDCTTSRAVKGA